MRTVRSLDDVFEIEIGGRPFLTGSEGLDGVLAEPQRPRGRAPARRRPR